MFIKFNRINSRGESKECLVNKDCVVGITENPTETEDLYNANGELVSSTPKAPTYSLTTTKFVCIVDKANYDIIVAELLK